MVLWPVLSAAVSRGLLAALQGLQQVQGRGLLKVLFMAVFQELLGDMWVVRIVALPTTAATTVILVGIQTLTALMDSAIGK
ncbi:hypothetical protein NL54_01765 [Pantoea stewartii]|uniref:hypothetical protein n=1 Tax=Pantoea stewartii TaxID=66269 RepID=UPI000543EB31|nr:hypothetical protein [Pantoea stewartii]KHE03329.1 hypothetical protein NL54_01765 [Pantoea stewartii]KHN61972.1 hypothetical protein OI73_14055 [Pantoea stewartii]MDF7784706.1 hypothetical protein [Pantoea stewartii]